MQHTRVSFRTGTARTVAVVLLNFSMNSTLDNLFPFLH